MLKISSI